MQSGPSGSKVPAFHRSSLLILQHHTPPAPVLSVILFTKSSLSSLCPAFSSCWGQGWGAEVAAEAGAQDGAAKTLSLWDPEAPETRAL